MSERSAILMLRSNWTYVCQAVCDNIIAMCMERDSSIGEAQEDATTAIRESVQKVLPVLFLAADKETFPELIDLYKDTVKASGFVVPEHYEDMAKQIVMIFKDGENE